MALRRIALRDFVIVQALDLDLHAGFTVLTGETGAGKSILIDALQLLLGARADTGVIREGAARTDICAEFDTGPAALAAWLDEAGFPQDDPLLLRRTVDLQGKSRAWINGIPATATQMRALGEHLLDIHGQHAWQSLTRPDAVRGLLDAYAGVQAQPLAALWTAWRDAQKALTHARAAQDTLQQERERLQWQITEVDKLAPREGEWDELNASHARLSNAQALLDNAQGALGALQGDDAGGALSALARAHQLLQGYAHVDESFRTLGEVLDSCIAQADIDKFITADPFVRKMTSFSWPPNRQLILLDRVLPGMKGKIGLWLGLSKFLSAGMIASLLKLPKMGGREEAVLLFTSGSSGDPKGVVLSHRNLLANVNQFGSRIDLRSDDKVLGCLPLFHSFGCTVTMWYPVIEGVSVVTYPSPLEVAKLAELIQEHSVSLILATPTFLRGYLRKATKEQLASVKMVITGAEKLPKKVAENFKELFGKPVLEGYGLTETSPVSNVNLPDAVRPDGARGPVLPNHRSGSVGQFIPGIAVRITDPDTQEPLPLYTAGMIWLRGSNIFEGYLNQPEKTASVMKNGWFMTGDIGRLDEDGFLYIEGRLSRFSKIGGEMVPHETVEDLINKALGHAEDERRITIVGVPDEAKGEALILLSSNPDIDLQELRTKLTADGIPALWIPKKIVDVAEIPILASGKLDIKSCEKLAQAGA